MLASTVKINRWRRNSGWTIVELLVVITVISLLISIILPSLQCARELSQQTKCQSTVKQLWFAHQIYVNENKGPYSTNDAHILYPDIPSDSPFWFCSSDKRTFDESIESESFTSYAIYLQPAAWFESHLNAETVREKSNPGHRGVRYIATWNGVQIEYN